MEILCCNFYTFNMKQIWLVSIIILHSFLKRSEVQVSATTDNENLYFQSKTSSYRNIVTPRKVDHKGSYLSHNLTHHHYEGFGRLHYHIELYNTTLHLELYPDTSFIAPLMVIERHRRDTRIRNKPRRTISNCHYQGYVKGDNHSKVALSACRGLVGLIRVQKGDYFLEPLRSYEKADVGHPHVIFQRSILKNKMHRRHHLKRRKGGKRTKSNFSNCGTKEPKRASEKRIEWQSQGKIIVKGGRATKAKHENFKLRGRRSISIPRNVEALVVADSSMIAFHEDGDIEVYLLTIMNMVSSLYKDPAIGNLVKIVVVRIILLDEEADEGESAPKFNVTHVAENTLQSFCNWQKFENPKDEEDPHHHDVAILITRKDICSASGCTTLGVANVAGMCRPERSCSVNEDNGITLAHTIAHEIGHNFGMYHDIKNTGCDGRAGSIVHVMAPSFAADTVQVSWSNCSRRDITQFLDQGLGKCLDDLPTEKEYEYPELPPGAVYNADLQCRLQFNTTDISVRMCSKPNEICSQLWCLVNDVCITQLRPAAAGTHCGRHKWCQQQNCVPVEELPDPVDGGWGNWSNWSTCSRSCGGGISMQSRQCENPMPANGGTFCIGERTRYKVCNLDLCPESSLSFRAQQCLQFNNNTFKGKLYNWLPYFDSHDPCELYCTDSEDTVIVPWGDSAADGTPCNIGRNDMCISGICRKVGCDWIVDSSNIDDICGVCAGDGNNCTIIRGDLNKNVNMSEGYHEITNIPSGARQIFIEEVIPSRNFIAIGKANSNISYLNGDRLISMSGEFMIADTIGLYERENDQEKLRVPGPIQHDIILYILVRGRVKDHSIKYEYALAQNSLLVPLFEWKLGDWSPCTTTCGGGVQYRLPICYQENKGIVDEENCWSNAEGSRPNKKARVCNEDPCPAHWWVGPWQLCPVTCKVHNKPEPVKRRSIMCIDQNEIALPDSRCAEEKKPIDTELCGTRSLCNESDEDDDDDYENINNNVLQK